jgi:hypothetical protein
VKAFIERSKSSINENKCRIKLSKFVLFLGLILVGSVVFSGAASATTYNINNSKSIQTTINNAHSGDTINLAAGTYNQHKIVVNKNLTIAGPTIIGTPTAVINAKQQGSAFNIDQGTTVFLKNLVIKNATDCGVNNLGNIIITNCNINYNAGATYYQGGGIYNKGTMTITNSNVNNNIAYYSGINYSTYGGGIYNIGKMTITKSNVNNNTAINLAKYNGPGFHMTYGGGIYNRGTMTITSSNVNNNTACYGGGVDNRGTMTITSSNVSSNIATLGNGGGICNAGRLSDGINITAKMTITSSYVNRNTAKYDGGGFYNNDKMTITSSKVSSNTAKYDGGGIYNYGGTVEAHFNQIYGNSAYNIYCDTGSLNAEKNWWGSNTNPSSTVHGNVDVTPWLTSPLFVTAADPVNGAVIVHNNQVITITFSEPIKTGSAYSSITVKNSSGVVKPMTSRISGNVLTLTPTYNFVKGMTYTITLPVNAVKDSAGNGLNTAYISKFIVTTA